MLLGLTFGAYGKTIRQIARNLKKCGGYFFPLSSPESRTVSTRGEVKRSVGETAPTQSVGARGTENSTSERGGTSHTRRAAAAGACGEAASASEEAEEAELRELQAQLAIETVKRQARAGPMAEAIRDLMASSPEAMDVLKPFLPGYRPVSVVSGQLSVAENLDVHREALPRAP